MFLLAAYFLAFLLKLLSVTKYSQTASASTMALWSFWIAGLPIVPCVCLFTSTNLVSLP
ncbi:hypothetical protein B4082_5524 [Bacillus cereus]|uniref:Uncharacterized protein n=1 Tax=Bacillus cereus TaxID=1396 RepID=A0A161RRV9_BACCE|nr:hypothetical protein B4082_5524 [Bacillus cereus]